MPETQHSTLTGAELHEPKGAESATLGSVYTSDGSGSGEWRPSSVGWAQYVDDGSAQVITTSPVVLSNDATTTEETYLPLDIRGSGSLWSSNKITPTNTGDSYTVHLKLPVTAKSGSAALLTVSLDIGGDTSPTDVIYSQDFSVSATPSFDIFVTIPVGVTADFKTNGGQFFVASDADTVTITNPSILIVKNSSGAN